jgi:uncharacterized protein
MLIEETVYFQSEGYQLHGVLAYDDDAADGPGVILCPAHPLLGGDMDNSVIASAHSLLAAQHYVCLRFNYLGQGTSAGPADARSEKENMNAFWETSRSPHDEKRLANAADAVGFMKSLQSVDPSALCLIGYSFGAYAAACAAAGSPDIAALVLIAPTIHFHDFSMLHAVAVPKLIISSDNDFSYTLPDLEKACEGFSGPRQVEILNGADHFFLGREAEVAACIADFLKTLPALHTSHGYI